MNLIEKLARTMKSTSTLIEMVNTGNPAKVIADLRERLHTLQEQLLDIREEVTALREEKLALTERLAEALGKKIDPDLYRRVTLNTGSVVYIEKGIHEQPDHKPVYFCAHCFHQGCESILQIQDEEFHRDRYKCNTCGSTALIPNDKEMTAFSVSSPSKWDV